MQLELDGLQRAVLLESLRTYQEQMRENIENGLTDTYKEWCRKEITHIGQLQEKLNHAD